jgi:hypothetical protein
VVSAVASLILGYMNGQMPERADAESQMSFAGLLR